jgi:hypothetical protein
MRQIPGDSFGRKFEIPNVGAVNRQNIESLSSNSVDDVPSIRYFDPRIRDFDWTTMEENSERGARLKEALGGRSNAWLAKQVGVVASTVHGYAHGKVPPADVALRICDVLGIDLRWYIDGQGVAVTPGDKLVMVPLIDYSGGMAADGIAYAESFLKHLATDPGSVRCMISSGVAMAPSVPEHAEVLFLPGAGVIDGAVHVVGIRNRLLVRRIRISASGGMEAVCDNPAFSREGSDLLEPDQIVGRALWVAHTP